MAVTVYAWPPVGALGALWDYAAPISESVSLLSGRRYSSARGPVRRVAQVLVSAQSSDRMGAGYAVMLKRLLNGGRNLVRLQSYPLARFLDPGDGNGWRHTVPVEWRAGDVDLFWTMPPAGLLWHDGRVLVGELTTSSGYPAINVAAAETDPPTPGLPPGRLIARPGEFITVFEDEDDTTGSIAQVLAPAWTNDAGVATIRLYSAPDHGGRVSIGTRDTGVFRVVGELPRALQPVRGDWSFDFQFEEVFADEVGGFSEVTSWWRPTTGPS